MNRVPLTMQDRIEAVASSVAAGVLIFLIAKLVHVLVARRNVRKLVIGQPTCWWMAISYFVGALIAICVSDDRRFLEKSVSVSGAIGMLCGFFIGLIHGGTIHDRVFPLTREDNDMLTTQQKKPPTES